MANLRVAWQNTGSPEGSPVLSAGEVGPLANPASLSVDASSGGTRCLEVALDPSALTVTANALAGVAHWLRLADASLKPLPARPGPLALARGDTYVALISGAGEPDAEQRMAAARFIHLRDYFNAEKLAEALMGELSMWEGLGVLVVECR